MTDAPTGTDRYASPLAIYAVLCLFVGFGGGIDGWFWPAEMPSYTWNDFVQTIGIVVLTMMWITADGRQIGKPPASGLRIATILFTPIGLLAHLLLSRRWTWALALWFGFVLGLVAAYLAGYLLVDAVLPDNDRPA